ncbi:MAG: hypothetical protein AAB855_03945, partial [Patescibacteria group bacterium]
DYMAHPANIKKKAIQLRKRGVSIPRIAKQLSIAKSTASNWVSPVPLPELLTRHLSENIRKANERGREVMRVRRMLENQKQQKSADAFIASVERKFDKNFWKLCAAILFWCEGSKRHLSSIGFINSDPQMIRMFLHAFRGAFELDEKKFRIVLHLHDYHEEEKQKEYWSRVTNIPYTQFTKSYRKPNTQIRKRDGYQGCVSLKYFDARLAKNLDALYHAFAKKYTGAW